MWLYLGFLISYTWIECTDQDLQASPHPILLVPNCKGRALFSGRTAYVCIVSKRKLRRGKRVNYVRSSVRKEKVERLLFPPGEERTYFMSHGKDMGGSPLEYPLWACSWRGRHSVISVSFFWLLNNLIMGKENVNKWYSVWICDWR